MSRVFDKDDFLPATTTTAEPMVRDDDVNDYTRMTITDSVITAQKVAVRRKPADVQERIRLLANMAGSDWYYTFPVKNKDGTKGEIAGPTSRCIMAVCREYGNCQLGIIKVEETKTHWRFTARFSDYETGFTLDRAFEQPKNVETIKTNRERQQQNAFGIGVSKALRNVGRNALPDYAQYAYDIARENIVELIGKRLEHFRKKAVSKFAELQVDVKRVERVLGKTPDKWVARDIAALINQLQAINDGMALPEDCWPPLEPRRDDDKQPDAVEVRKEPEAKPEQEKQSPTFTLYVEGDAPGTRKVSWTGQDVGAFTRRVLAEAFARQRDRERLDKLWELNSDQWGEMPEDGAKALRDAWPQYTPPEPEQKSAGFTVVRSDGTFIDVATEGAFCKALLAEASELGTLGELNGLWESNKDVVAQINPGKERLLREEWAALEKQVASGE